MMRLSARPAFNAAVRHVKKALGILEALEGGENFADTLGRPPYGGLSFAASLSLLNLLLADKLGYTALSANPPGYAADIPALAAEFKRWKAVDLVAVFHDPRFPRIVNPKNAEHLAALGSPFPRDLLVVYAGGAPGELAAKAARTALALFSGAEADVPTELCAEAEFGAPVKRRAKSPETAPKTAPGASAERRAKTAPGASADTLERRTPLYSVPVTNDLFHNGNVEAWKRVIGDYEGSRPGLKVHVYYDGEPVLNLNALFAWGKAPRGGVVRFAVSSAGGAAPNTARLRRLLAQAASPDFGIFLGGPDGGRPALF
jgi:hypothetical protein